MNTPRKYFIHPSAIVETEKIGLNTRVWAFSHIMSDVIIGEDCNIGGNCFIESGVQIGDNVVIKNGISIWNGVKIEDRVFLGPNVVLTNDLNPRSGYPRPFYETIFKNGSTVGAGSVILSGIKIGEFSFIGAGSVVTRDVYPHSLVYGNPAKNKGWVCVCGLKLNKIENFHCVCGKKFEFQEDRLVEI